jgi:hypothetical protein
MSWFNANNFSDLVKQAVNSVESSLDNILEIENESGSFIGTLLEDTTKKESQVTQQTVPKEPSVFERRKLVSLNKESMPKRTEEQIDYNVEAANDRDSSGAVINELHHVHSRDTAKIIETEQKVGAKSSNLSKDTVDYNEDPSSTLLINQTSEVDIKPNDLSTNHSLTAEDDDKESHIQPDTPKNTDTTIQIEAIAALHTTETLEVRSIDHTAESLVPSNDEQVEIEGVHALKMSMKELENELLESKKQNESHKNEIVNLQARVGDLEALNARIHLDLEKKSHDYQNLVREHEKKDQLHSSTSEMKKLLQDKEIKLQGLLEEGEGLAKDILKANNTIKLVKGREDKLKKEVETLKKSVDSKNQETAELHKKIEILSSSEKRFKGIRL